MYSKEDKERIYLDFRKKVFGYIFNKINDREESEDLCQDVFVKVYENLDKFDESKSNLSTWIFHITKNTLTDYYRTRKVNTELSEEIPDAEMYDELDSIYKEETLEELAEALTELSEKERNVIVLHYYHNMTLKDIAEKMGYSYVYIRVIHDAALKKLKEKLD